MRLVLDTNVLVSGIFFSGPPSQILSAWQQRKLEFVISVDILAEYQRVAAILGEKFPAVDLQPILDLIAVNSDIIDAPALPHPVSEDPDDDMFLACAIAGRTGLIVSGDKHLLDVNGYQDIRIIKPREFVDTYLAN